MTFEERKQGDAGPTFEKRRRNRDFPPPIPEDFAGRLARLEDRSGESLESSPAAGCCRRSGPRTGAAGNRPSPTNCGP